MRLGKQASRPRSRSGWRQRLGELSEKEDRFAGALLGTACGDALGAPLKFSPRAREVRNFLSWRNGRGRYTGATQMTLALTESLLRCRRVNGADCARAYAQRYDPRRGYGGSARVLLPMLKEGADYRTTGTVVFPLGSPGSGGAARIAPIGLIYGAGRGTGLYPAVFEAIRCTHIHPEAVDGALVQARLVGTLSALSSLRLPAFADVKADLLRRTGSMTFAARLDTLATLLAVNADEKMTARLLGTGPTAIEAVLAAIWCAFRHGFHPEESVVRAVALGGDTSTIAAMTGALVGAFRGASRLPARWLAGLENGPLGRDDILDFACRLAALPKRRD